MKEELTPRAATRPELRNVLFLAFYFPPLGGGGVQRSLRFVQHLPEFGYRTTVVTRPEAQETAWGPRDPTLTNEIPEGTRVIRVAGPEPPRGAGWRGRAERWLRLRTQFDRWWADGVVQAAAGAARTADVTLATMSPWASAEAAGRLARSSGKPWVADLRDPWALDEWLVYPSRLHRRLERTRMRRALATAEAIIMNTPESTAQLVDHFPELGSKHIVTITNGYDIADFAGAPLGRTDDVFRIVHAGHHHTDEGGSAPTRAVRRALGGAYPGLRIATRSHLFVMRAVEQLLAGHPRLRGRIELHLAGVIGDEERAALPDWVRAHGYLSHRETIAMLRSADLLFLPMHDLPPGMRSRIVPGKTYEYLAAGPPILAAVPDGDARELLERAGHSLVCRPADVASMSRVIADQLERADRGERPPAARADVVAAYERRHLTQKLAALLDTVVGAPEPTDTKVDRVATR